jgi:hypothetical protein
MWNILSKAFEQFRRWSALKTLLELAGVWKWIVLGAAVVGNWLLPSISRWDPAFRVLAGLATTALALMVVLFAIALRKAIRESRTSGERSVPEKDSSPANPKTHHIVIALLLILLAVIGAIFGPTPLPSVLPGISVNGVVRLKHLPVERRKYIFDFGTMKTGRLSIYISSDSIFTLSFLDPAGEAHPVQIPLGGDGIPLEQFFSLSCGIGIDRQSTKMYITVNGKEARSLELPFRVDVGSLDITNAILGADVSTHNAGAFDLKEFGVSYNTLDGKTISALSTNAEDFGTNAYMSFEGHQWMKRGVGNHNFVQEVASNRPILKLGK